MISMCGLVGKSINLIDHSAFGNVLLVKGVDGMRKSSARPAGEIENVIEIYGNMLFRLCLVMLGNSDDAEDALQETFIKYLQKAPEFRDPEHEKAWLIKVATNKCRDMLRFKTRQQMVDIDVLNEFTNDSADSGILEALMTLPEKFRIVLVLYYVEEYSTEEIAEMIGKTKSAVKMRLQKGRRLLEEIYRKEYM